MNHVSAKSLYKTVAGLGLTRAQVRQLLPAWWSEDLESAKDGVAELALHMSRRLSIDLSALLRGNLVSKGAVAGLAFKHRANVDQNTLTAASSIASSLSHALLPTARPFAHKLHRLKLLI